jgi:hypothetical protein
VVNQTHVASVRAVAPAQHAERDMQQHSERGMEVAKQTCRLEKVIL